MGRERSSSARSPRLSEGDRAIEGVQYPWHVAVHFTSLETNMAPKKPIKDLSKKGVSKKTAGAVKGGMKKNIRAGK